MCLAAATFPIAAELERVANSLRCTLGCPSVAAIDFWIGSLIMHTFEWFKPEAAGAWKLPSDGRRGGGT